MIFADLERAIYREMCSCARQLTQDILERCDEALQKSRNKKEYELLTTKVSTIKTVYGEVSYKRRYYRHNGKNVFLLDEQLKTKAVGQFSENLAGIIADTAMQMSYRQTAEKICSMTGVSISHGGVWEVVQSLGKRAEQEEKGLLSVMKKEELQGKLETDILFEEMDGIYLAIQGADRKKYRKKKQEMKVGIAYRGWQKDGAKLCLKDKVMTAGFYSSREFHALREAGIRRVYNVDEIGYRVLNGDGAPWIKDTYEADTIYQLDRFHIEQELRRCIPDKRIQKEIRSLLYAGKTRACLEYIETYANSLEGVLGAEQAAENARKLYEYLSNNEEGLLPYTRRGLKLPKPPEGIEYRENLGTCENHNYSVIAKRMKHNRTSWSIRGATHMAKLLTLRENGTMAQFIQRHGRQISLPLADRDVLKGFSAADVPEKEGRGEMREPIHVALRDWKRSPGIQAILRCMEQQEI